MLQKANPKNRDLLININGDLIHRDQAGISPFDSVVQGGDAVWEGLRLYDGRIFKLEHHLDRLRHSALALAFAEIPRQKEIIDEIRRTLTRGVKITSGMDPRLNTAGPTLIVLAEHKAPVYGSQPIRLMTSSIRRFPPDCMDPKIHHNNLIQSILAKIEANAAGADDALMLDRQGFVAETNATHVFLVRDGVVATSHCHACPEGVTRSTVLELCRNNGIPHQVADFTQAELYRADEAFCTGTMGELVAVAEVDGRPIGGTDRPVLERLQGLFRELTAVSGYPILS